MYIYKKYTCIINVKIKKLNNMTITVKIYLYILKIVIMYKIIIKNKVIWFFVLLKQISEYFLHYIQF